jgi:hypothetical protein
MIVLILTAFCASHIFIHGGGISHHQKERELNMDLPNEQNDSGSVDPLAQAIVDAVRKSGGKAWLGPPPPEEIKKLRAEKADRDVLIKKNRAVARERHMKELKERTRRKLRGEIPDE